MFHAYGQFMRPLTFDEPSPMLMMKYRAGRKFRALWNGVFRSVDGELGVFIVNAAKDETAYTVTMELARHGMTADTVVDVDRIAPTGQKTSMHRGVGGSVTLKGVLPGRSITMYHVRSVQ